MKRGVKALLSTFVLFIFLFGTIVNAQLYGEVNNQRNSNTNTNTFNEEAVRTKIEATPLRQESLQDVESTLLRETQQATETTTRRDVSRSINEITRAITSIFEPRAPVEQKERENVVEKIQELQKTNVVIKTTRDLQEKEKTKLEITGRQLTQGIETRVIKSAGESSTVTKIKRLFKNIGFSDGEIPILSYFNPNPLDFNKCSKNGETCKLEIYVQNTYQPYLGQNDNSFTFIVANLLQPDGVTWGDDIIIYNFEYVAPEIMGYMLDPVDSGVLKVRLANYYKGDIFYSDSKVLQVVGTLDYYSPEIYNLTENPVDFSSLQKNQQGFYELELNGNNFFPPYVDAQVSSSTLFIRKLGSSEDAEVINFTYVDGNTILVETTTLEKGEYALTLYNYVNGKILQSNHYVVVVMSGDVSEGEITTYTYDAKFEPPEGMILHGMGQWDDASSGNPKYIDMLTDSGDNELASENLMPASKLIFVAIANNARWQNFISNLPSILNTVNSQGIIPHLDIALRDEKPADLYPGYPEYGIDDEVAHTTNWDDRIIAIADAFAENGKPAFIRIGGEFNGDWNGYHSYDFPIAYRKVVDIFRERGADNVAFIWCYEPAAPADFMDKDASGNYKWFPGNDYIDWYGLDVFVPEDFTPGGYHYSNSIKFLDSAVSAGKPVMLAETSVAKLDITPIESDGMNDWNKWFVPFFKLMEDREEIKAFYYINYNWPLAGEYLKLGWKNADISVNEYITQKYLEEVSKNKYLYSKDRELLNEYINY